MTKTEAEKLLANFFASFGKADFAFKQSNAVKANIGEAILGFEFQEHEQSLACHALIYRFHRAPRPAVLRELKVAEKNGAETAGGEIVFDAENRNLSLVKVYFKNIEPLMFAAQMQKLATASLIWSSLILDRVATKSSE